MASNVNLLDKTPQAVIQGLNWILAPLEDPVGLDRPRWMDSARYQGIQNFFIQAANGVWGHVFRAGISWGYEDPCFARNWGESDGVINYTSSYHVIYPDQQIKPQVENWVKIQPKIRIIPRVIDLELENGTPASMIARQVWEMSERVADYDGIRPWIYSRKNLIEKWLVPYWTIEQLNEHFWWLAQYLWDRIREHAGPPDLPKGIQESRVVLHQTADKKSTPDGETESRSIDWDRWELGNVDQMINWIESIYGSSQPPQPPGPDPEPQPDPEIIIRIEALETQAASLEIDVANMKTEMESLETWVADHEMDHLEGDSIQVKALEKVALALVVGHDKACEGSDPPGKPILEPPTEGRVVINEGAVVKVRSRAVYSCKDDPNTPEILATGGIPFYILSDGQPGAGMFLRKDKTGPA